jgi:hypothetical protein
MSRVTKDEDVVFSSLLGVDETGSKKHPLILKLQRLQRHVCVYAVEVRRKKLGFVRYVLRYDDSAKTVEFGGIGSGLGSLIPVMPSVRWRDINCTGATNKTVTCHDAVFRIAFCGIAN